MQEAYRPALIGLRDPLPGLAGMDSGDDDDDVAEVRCLARTHGQPAITGWAGTAGVRWNGWTPSARAAAARCPAPPKFGSATGNFNAHHAAYPELDWVKLAEPVRCGRKQEAWTGSQFTARRSSTETTWPRLLDAMRAG